MSPIRIFVGCAVNDDLESQAVVEWSLRKHTSRELDITWMQLSRDMRSPFYSDGPAGWQTKYWVTPFSGFRWAVPELCRFEGEAIYTDSDVIFRADIGALWDQPIPDGKVAIAKNPRRFCVSKWACERFRYYELPSIAVLRRDPYSHRSMMRYFEDRPGLVEPFAGGDWNVLDLERFNLASPKTKALHCTGIPNQPQFRHALPRLKGHGVQHWYGGPTRPALPEIQSLFDRMLEEAVGAGYGPERYRVPGFGRYDIRGGR